MNLRRLTAFYPQSDRSQSALATTALLLFVIIGLLRIISTYHVFNQITDEPAHIACGMEWLDHGTYTFEPLHPPLARVAVALGPYLSGIRLSGQKSMWKEGNEILSARNRYMHNLALARIGVLPFFVLGAVVVYFWAREQYGNGPAILATLLFTTAPTVLAHAGLATTDLPVATCFAAELWAFIGWLQRHTYLRSTMLGLTCALAILCKLSALGFTVACGLALFASRWLLKSGEPEKEKTKSMDRLRWPGAIAIVALVTCVVIWAGYRFQVGSLSDGPRPHVMVDATVGPTGTIHDWANSAVEARWIPAPAFWQGIRQLKEKQSQGHRSYLLGQVKETGWWYFFPVALATKTSIPFLILVGIGSFYLGKAAGCERNWVKAAPVTAALALLVLCGFSHITIGLRHLLAIYSLLAIIGGVGACHLWRRATPRFVGPSMVVILLLWHLTSSFQAHPDYLSYFNEFAGHHPERILIDSDLDWGQDLLRLSAALKKRDVREVSIAYSGTADLDRFDLPPFRILQAHRPATGWIAISMLALKTGEDRYAPTDSFTWLESYNPVCTVGASIRLYYVPEPVPSR